MGIGLLIAAIGAVPAAAAPIALPADREAAPSGPTLEPCADPEPIVTALEAAATEGRLADARAAKERVLGAFGCRLADPGLLARVWLADAVVLATEGDGAGSSDALAAAARSGPDAWRDVYGSEFRRQFDAAAAAEAPTGRLVLTLEPPSDAPHTIAIDGVRADTVPVELPSGLHLAQAGYGDDVRFVRELYVVAGQDLLVGANLGPPPVEPARITPGFVEPPEPVFVDVAGPVEPASDPSGPRPDGKPFPTLLALGGLTGAAAIGTAVGAVLQNGAMRQATDLPSLEAAYRQQRVLGGTSYALFGVTAAFIGLEIAW